MAEHPLSDAIRSMRTFFERTASCLEEKDSAFAPKPGMFSAAQQVAHSAQVVEWFIEGAFRPEGFDTNFESMDLEVRKVSSLAEARKWFGRACDKACEVLDKKTQADLQEPIGGQIMAGMPRAAIIGAISDHSAHHRGSLAVYARLLGKTPPMPYMSSSRLCGPITE